MPKVRLHPPVKSISGKLGIYTLRVMYGKQTLMKTPDMSGVKWSKAQKESRERFREAIRYAKQAMADPQVRVAVSDFLAGKNLLTKP